MGDVWEDVALHMQKTVLEAAGREEEEDGDEREVGDGLGSIALAMAEAVGGGAGGRLEMVSAFNRFLRGAEEVVRESNARAGRGG